MRDPDRIDRVLSKLSVYWKANPDLRLGQIVSNLTQKARTWILEEAQRASYQEWSDTLRHAIFYIEDDEIMEAFPKPCAACGKDAEGNHTIHRDGFGKGPKVPICNACGADVTPSCPDLWDQIAERRLYEAL